jgi:hypothetical protein
MNDMSINVTVSNPYVTCAKLQIKQYPSTAPVIYDWSYYYDSTQNLTVITIIGANFRYFSTVQLGYYNIEVIYISSTLIQVNVPRNITTGVYSLQVINDNLVSNSINYTQAI